jgi:shikimate dehydrogenase
MTDLAAVSFVSGATRLYAIIGHPIEQVRSPELITAEFHRRGLDALMLPVHVLPEDFETVLPALMKLHNLDGLVFTVPFKLKACALADELGPQAEAIGAINAMARGADGRWRGEMFDGLGCVEAFRRRGLAPAGKHVMLIGAGGAGSAIGVAMAFEQAASIRLYDEDIDRAEVLAEKIRKVNASIPVTVGTPEVADRDLLVNATPVGMLGDPRLPIPQMQLPPGLAVLDAVTKPERTPLLTLAERSGCQVLFGRAMMAGQISRIADHFGIPDPARQAG